MTIYSKEKNLYTGNSQREACEGLRRKKNMSVINEISEALQRGKKKDVTRLVQQAIDEGVDAVTILKEGLLDGMNIIGEKFKNDEVFVPEVLVAARAMNAGTALLKPLLSGEAAEPLGKARSHPRRS